MLGQTAIRAATAAGLRRDSIRSVLRGRVPSVDRAAEICTALGLELYIGPPRGGVPRSVNSPDSHRADPATPEVVPPPDRRLAALLAAVGDHYRALNEPGRAALIVRLEHCFPELRPVRDGRAPRAAARSQTKGGTAIIRD